MHDNAYEAHFPLKIGAPVNKVLQTSKIPYLTGTPIFEGILVQFDHFSSTSLSKSSSVYLSILSYKKGSKGRSAIEKRCIAGFSIIW